MLQEQTKVIFIETALNVQKLKTFSGVNNSYFQLMNCEKIILYHFSIDGQFSFHALLNITRSMHRFHHIFFLIKNRISKLTRCDANTTIFYRLTSTDKKLTLDWFSIFNMISIFRHIIVMFISKKSLGLNFENQN